MQTRKDIEELVKAGIAEDIFRAERAYTLLRTSGERSTDINDRAKGDYSSLFLALQQALTTESVLALARIYDNPNPRYPTRCLQGLLAHLSNTSTELPDIREPGQLISFLELRDAPKEVLDAVIHSPSKFPTLFPKHVNCKLSAAQHVESLELLKTFRDKGLAHNERSNIASPTWEGLLALLDIAKYVVGAIGWAYLSTAYIIDGEYILTRDAEKPSKGLSRLLTTIYGTID